MQKESFERLFKDHMPSIKAGLPEMPDEEDMGGFPEFFFEQDTGIMTNPQDISTSSDP